MRNCKIVIFNDIIVGFGPVRFVVMERGRGLTGLDFDRSSPVLILLLILILYRFGLGCGIAKLKYFGIVKSSNFRIMKFAILPYCKSITVNLLIHAFGQTVIFCRLAQVMELQNCNVSR